MPTNQQQSEAGRIIDGRYRVEADLGRGGMGRVYRCVDERSGYGVALKALSVTGKGTSRLQATFGREYHTLVQLRHPHIIRVLDYGLDDGNPYYTMELLQGSDAATATEQQPLTIQGTCMLLRDAASALALIHSRRLVHRDVSPRNVWCMPDGCAKLIDFGTLVAMGPQTRIAGTPPFMPPEAVYLQPLDARSDLYSLGAVAYYLLTSRHPYPACDLAHVQRLWKHRPKTPVELRPEVPAALSELVQALLSLDARGRPHSAAEVYERLTAIAELPRENDPLFAEAFLNNPRLVGRDEASAALRKRIAGLRKSRGGGVATLVGDPGLGRSRMLASAVLEAKLLGVAAIAVDATAVGAGPLALATALAERLVEEVPLAAAASADHARELAHVSPVLREALGNPPLAELDTFSRMGKLSSALVSLFSNACRRQHLVIAIDAVHRADGASLAVLGQLSVAASRVHLLLVGTSDRASLCDPPPVLGKLLQERDRIELSPLQPADTRDLLESLFGSVPGLEAIAGWLHELSGGSPGACMQYAQYLVDRGVAHYEAGRWKLPERLQDQGLPESLSAMLSERLSDLGEDAKLLGLGLALARDETRSAWQPEQSVRLEDFPKLLDDVAGAGRTSRAIDELLQVGLLEQRNGYYVLGQRATVAALLQASAPQARKQQHLRLAEVFARPGYHNDLAPVVHLQHAGEDGLACRRLVAHAEGEAGRPVRWATMRVSMQAQCAQRALAHWQATNGAPRDGALLRRMLLAVCPVYDWELARFGRTQIAQAHADSGLCHWEQTDPGAKPLARVVACLERAKQEYEAKPEPERCLSPIEAVRELGACCILLGGAAVNSHDLALAHELPPIIERLRVLSPLLDLIGELCDLSLARLTGRRVDARMWEAADRLILTEGLPDRLSVGGAAVLRQVQGLHDARFGRARALAVMQTTAERNGRNMFIVAHVDWLAHAFRGNGAEAARAYKDVEVITEDDAWRRRGHLFAEAELHALAGNLFELTRVGEAIAELAEHFPGWRPWLGYARGMAHWLRGDLAQAVSELDGVLAEAHPGEHRAWVVVAPARALLRLMSGDADGALRDSDAIQREVGRRGLEPSAEVAAERVRALALSARTEHGEARAALQRALELAAALKMDGLPLAVLVEAQARVELAAADLDASEVALKQLRDLLEHADAPTLVAAYEALRLQTSEELAVLEHRSLATVDFSEVSAVVTEVTNHLTASATSNVRCRRALELVLEDAGLKEGHIFLVSEQGLYEAASIGPRSDELLELATQAVDSHSPGTRSATIADAIGPPNLPSPLSTRRGVCLAPAMLWSSSSSAKLVGIILLSSSQASLQPPRDDLLQAIAHCLVAAGDTRELEAG